jgi:4-azaleucine resistance transporter AzlC
MVNARHIFYGISMLDRYKGMGKVKPYLIFSLTDETYSLVCRDEGGSLQQRRRYYIFVSLFNHAYWVVGSLLGSLVGSLVSFNSEGIDFALTALFVTVFLEQWLSAKKYLPALVGVLASILSLVIFGRDRFLIPAMLIIALLLCFCKEGKGVKENDSE